MGPGGGSNGSGGGGTGFSRHAGGLALVLTALASLVGEPMTLARAAELEEAGHREPAAGSAHLTAQSAVPYDGRFTFTRIRYGGARGFGGRGFGGGASWAHDYPSADLNMQVVLEEVTTVNPMTGTSNVLDLENPAPFQNPILYLSEPGFWSITDVGARNLRTHLLKGGFIIFDDFDGYGHWENFQAQIGRALPEYRLFELADTHPVFRSFFGVDDIYVPHPLVRGRSVKPQYFGIFEDNDPTGRMMALINYNADLAEYWEWSTTGYLPIDPTNDAYRLGVNYFIYGLTH